MPYYLAIFLIPCIAYQLFNLSKFCCTAHCFLCIIGITRKFICVASRDRCLYAVMKLYLPASKHLAQVVLNGFDALFSGKPLHAFHEFRVLVQLHNFGLVILVVPILFI